MLKHFFLSALIFFSGCTTTQLIGMPSVSIDDSGLGNNLIANQLKKDSVWAGGARYQNGATSSDSNDNIYPLIQQQIQKAQANRLPIESVLNASNLGVICQNNFCKYQGSYQRILHNVPNIVVQGKVVSTKTITEQATIEIIFNPNNLKATYKVKSSKN